MHLIGTFSDYKKHIPQEWRESNSHFDEAVETYLDMGGILKVENGISPMLVYPGKGRLQSQKADMKRRKNYFDVQIRNLERRKQIYTASDFFSSLSRFGDPLYWEHIARFNMDQGYKETTLLVDPPVNRMRDARWRKMMRMYVKNQEYRERLKEARTSIIGKKRESTNETAHRSREGNRKTIDNRLNGLKEDRDRFHKRIRALNILMAWAK